MVLGLRQGQIKTDRATPACYGCSAATHRRIYEPLLNLSNNIPGKMVALAQAADAASAYDSMTRTPIVAMTYYSIRGQGSRLQFQEPCSPRIMNFLSAGLVKTCM